MGKDYKLPRRDGSVKILMLLCSPHKTRRKHGQTTPKPAAVREGSGSSGCGVVHPRSTIDGADAACQLPHDRCSPALLIAVVRQGTSGQGRKTHGGFYHVVFTSNLERVFPCQGDRRHG